MLVAACTRVCVECVCGVCEFGLVVEVRKVCVLGFSAVCVVLDVHNETLQKRKLKPAV